MKGSFEFWVDESTCSHVRPGLWSFQWMAWISLKRQKQPKPMFSDAPYYLPLWPRRKVANSSLMGPKLCKYRENVFTNTTSKTNFIVSQECVNFRFRVPLCFRLQIAYWQKHPKFSFCVSFVIIYWTCLKMCVTTS